MKKTKEQKGITLVALIITIVVLLILALVTINAVRGDGIIGKAQHARDEYQRKSDEEQSTLGGYLAFLEGNTPGNNQQSKSIVGKILEENRTINGEAYSSTNPLIPAGFMAINIEGEAIWDAEGGPQVDNGLVISDGTNEFVWVPVTSTIVAYNVGTTDYREPDVITGGDNNPAYLEIINNILETNYQNSADLKTALTEDFDSMATSVNKYGGFYVGRYEMSLSNDKIAQSKYGEISSDASQEDTNTWYGLYARAKTYTNAKGSVKSSMIWGSQYDAMMTWMGSAANTTIDGKNTTRTTGSVETDKIKNVYDLYGNSFEWTLEAYDTGYRVGRGGNCDYARIPSNRSNHRDPNSTVSHSGSRLTLYIV